MNSKLLPIGDVLEIIKPFPLYIKGDINHLIISAVQPNLNLHRYSALIVPNHTKWLLTDYKDSQPFTKKGSIKINSFQHTEKSVLFNLDLFQITIWKG